MKPAFSSVLGSIAVARVLRVFEKEELVSLWRFDTDMRAARRW
jgi:hypothetical protein